MATSSASMPRRRSYAHGAIDRSRSVALPVDVPEAGDGRRELEVAAEALEARLVRKALLHKVEELRGVLPARIAELEPTPLAAFPARDVDPHASAGATRPLADAAGRREERLARAGREDTDRDGLRHAATRLHEERAVHEAALAVGRGLERVVAVVEVEVAVERREVDLLPLRIERPLHLGVRLPPDHVLGDLDRLRAAVDRQQLRPVDAGDEVRIVLDVDESVVDGLASSVDQRPVLELRPVVLADACLAEDEVLGLAPVHRAIAAGDRDQRDAQDSRPKRHGALLGCDGVCGARNTPARFGSNPTSYASVPA